LPGTPSKLYIAAIFVTFNDEENALYKIRVYTDFLLIKGTKFQMPRYNGATGTVYQHVRRLYVQIPRFRLAII
jgi:hypothetical protein